MTDLKSLLLSSDLHITLSENCTLSERVVPNGPKVIDEAGFKVSFLGDGGVDPTAAFEMKNGTIEWQTTPAWYMADQSWPPQNWLDPFNPAKVGIEAASTCHLKLRNVTITLNVAQGAPSGSGGSLPPSAWLINLMGGSAEFENVTVKGIQPYGAGFLTGYLAHDLVLKKVKLKKVHFPVRLHTPTNVLIEDFTSLYCSFGSLYFVKPTNLTILRPNIRYSGDGTQGDGINICGCNGVYIEGGSIIGAGCYGFWLNGPLGYPVYDVTVVDLAIEESLTSGFYISGAANQKATKIKLQALDLGRNGGWGLAALNYSDLTVNEQTIFRGNVGRTTAPQHYLDDNAAGLTAWNCVIAKNPFPDPPAQGVLPYVPYSYW